MGSTVMPRLNSKLGGLWTRLPATHRRLVAKWCAEPSVRGVCLLVEAQEVAPLGD